MSDKRTEDMARHFDETLKQSLAPCDYNFMLDLNRSPRYPFPKHFTDAGLAMDATVKEFGSGTDRNAVWKAWRKLHN
jgi:hypothetical protein